MTNTAMHRRFWIVIFAAGCGAPGVSDPAGEVGVSVEDLRAAASPIFAWDPITSHAAALKAAAALIKGPRAVQLAGSRTVKPDNLHTLPQPTRPLYTWTWTFRSVDGKATADVIVGKGQKAKAALGTYDPTTGAPPIDLSTVHYRARDLYKELVAAYPDETHHAYDDLLLVGPMAGDPQGWQITTYEQGNDDRMFFVDAAKGGASEMSID